MAFILFDARVGAQSELRPASPPRVCLHEDASVGERGAELAALLRRALAFHGYVPVTGGAPDAAIALLAPPAGLWLRPAALRGAPCEDERRARGYHAADWRLYLARAAYREPLDFSWEGLDDARAERARLTAAARALAGVTAEADARGLAGYRQRFRDRLGRDLDLRGALDAVWDGLRPGALSPGSRAGLLRLAESALELDLPRFGST